MNHRKSLQMRNALYSIWSKYDLMIMSGILLSCSLFFLVQSQRMRAAMRADENEQETKVSIRGVTPEEVHNNSVHEHSPLTSNAKQHSGEPGGEFQFVLLPKQQMNEAERSPSRMRSDHD